MSKTETSRQLAAASNEKRLEHLASQIKTLHQAKAQNAEELTAILEPLAQAMAALSEETRETLSEIRDEAQTQADAFQDKISRAMLVWTSTLGRAEDAARSLSKAANQTKAMFIALALGVGISSALLTTAFLLWLAPGLMTPTAMREGSVPPTPAASTAPPAPSKSKSKH